MTRLSLSTKYAAPATCEIISRGALECVILTRLRMKMPHFLGEPHRFGALPVGSFVAPNDATEDSFVHSVRDRFLKSIAIRNPVNDRSLLLVVPRVFQASRPRHVRLVMWSPILSFVAPSGIAIAPFSA
jgi:hypothetical protein